MLAPLVTVTPPPVPPTPPEPPRLAERETLSEPEAWPSAPAVLPTPPPPPMD